MLRIPLVTLLVCGSTAAQSSVQPAPRQVLRDLGLRAAQVQQLQIQSPLPAEPRIHLSLAGRAVVMTLRPVDLRSRDFKVLVDDGQSLRAIPAVAFGTYQGELLGMPGTQVAASILGGKLWATIHTSTATYGVQPLQGRGPRTHVVYAQVDLVGDATRCGVGNAVGAGHAGAESGGVTQKEAEIAIDCDNAFYKRNNQSTTSVQTSVMRVINAMDVIYQRDVAIRYKVTTILIRTTKVYAGTSTGSLLSEMRTRWRNQHSSIRRDLAHMFTGVGNFSGVIGTAYVGVVCGGAGYGVSKAFSSNHTRNVGLVSHECGHNWGSGHCNNNTPCYIMCSGLGGCGRRLTEFGAYAQGRISNHRDSRNCLRTLSPGGYSYFGAGCAGSNQKVPDLTAPAIPQIGTNFDLQLSDGLPSAPVALWFGVSAQSWGSIQLPLDLQLIGAPGCVVRASAEVIVPLVTNTSGQSLFRIALPNDTTFVGRNFYNQAFVVDPRANTAGLAITRAGAGRLGY